jgi:hypothetical protein
MKSYLRALNWYKTELTILIKARVIHVLVCRNEERRKVKGKVPLLN